MKTLSVLSALLTIVVVVSLAPGLAQGSAATDPSPLPQPSGPSESQHQSSQSILAQVAAPDSMPGRVPIVLHASKGVAPFRIASRPFPALRRAQHATFIINYVPAGTQNELGDDCLSWPAGSQAAFQYAADLWGALLSSSVPIKIDACWASLGEGVLGHSATDSFYRNFSGAPQSNTWYSVALANALSGTDRNGDTAEMHIAYSDNGISWYFGTDGNPSMGEYDFVSVVLHEIAHGLNFAGSMQVSGGQGSWGFTGYPNVPVIYDRFAENGSGQALINTSLFPNPSTQLAAQLTSNNVYFNGTYANAANGSQRPKLYAPSTWQQGSSYTHLDEIFNGTANALMTYSLNDGESVHDPGPITCGILHDLGWQNPCASTPIVGIHKAVLSSDLKPGDRITFTLSIANTGAVTATSVVVTDIVPIQVLTPTYGSSLPITPTGGSPFVWNVGTLDVGQSGVITIYGQIDPSLTSGWSFSNIAYISDPADTTLDNKSSRVTVGGGKVYLPVVMQNWPPIVSHTYYASTDDTVLESAGGNTWYGSYSDFAVGYCTISPYNIGVARSILRFDLSSIPAGAYIKSATLQPYLIGYVYQTGQSSNMVVTAYRINQVWPGSPTWNNFANAYAESYGSTTVGTSFVRSNIDVTVLVQGWVNGTWPNYGMMLRGQEGSYCNLKDFASADSSSSYWPQLLVEYADPTAIGSTVTVAIPAERLRNTSSTRLLDGSGSGGGLEYRFVK
jgi:uncharacterized repeat protein (TIGR01451 family)